MNINVIKNVSHWPPSRVTEKSNDVKKKAPDGAFLRYRVVYHLIDQWYKKGKIGDLKVNVGANYLVAHTPTPTKQNYLRIK